MGAESDPFDSSRRKLSRAKKHLANLNRKFGAFFKQDLYEFFTDPDPDRPETLRYKIRLIKKIPADFSEITGDIVDNLRAALDHAMYGVAVASGCANPINAYFPFSGSAARFESNLNGRCADVPKDIYPLLRSYQPYKGGSQLLFALNEVSVANKHKLLIPVGAVTSSTGVDVIGSGGWLSMPYPMPQWDSAKNEMELFTAGPGAKLRGNFKFGAYVAFGEVGTVKGKNAMPVLISFVQMVETIIDEIEAESRRL